MLNDLTESVLKFWFKDVSNTSTISMGEMAHWWQKDINFDQIVRGKFSSTLTEVASGQYDELLKAPEGRLALIILCDQFSRNIYRGKAEAFTYDKLALKFAVDGVALGHDKQLAPIQRVFMYMPFEHSEDHNMQIQSIELFTALFADASAEQKAIFNGFLDYAKQHKDIIDKFGRYPHRNAILNRKSTAEEIAHIKNHAGF